MEVAEGFSIPSSTLLMVFIYVFCLLIIPFEYTYNVTYKHTVYYFFNIIVITRFQFTL